MTSFKGKTINKKTIIMVQHTESQHHVNGMIGDRFVIFNQLRRNC